VLETLKELPFVDSTSTKEYGTRCGKDDSAQVIHFSCLHPREKFCESVLISEDELKALGLSVNFTLEMEGVLNKLDPPEYVGYGGYHPEVCANRVLHADPDPHCVSIAVADEHLNTYPYQHSDHNANRDGHVHTQPATDPHKHSCAAGDEYVCPLAYTQTGRHHFAHFR
jgi:hypothetical protein